MFGSWLKQNPEAFWEVAPNLAVQVTSPSDTADVIKGEATDYLRAGTELVWLIYPKFKEVEAHTPAGTMQTFCLSDPLRTDILPGFECRVAELFEP